MTKNTSITTTTTATTYLSQLHGILKAIYSRGGITGLSHILSSQPYAWPLATHLSPTESGTVNNDETFGNVALPTPSCEYYTHAIEANVTATVSISHPGQENGILFCSVAAYDVHGNPLLINDNNNEYDQLTPLSGETATKTWTGPIILVARYYKSSNLRCKWVSQINKEEWSLPTISLIDTNNAQQHHQRRLLPIASVEQQQAFTNRIQPFLQRAVINVAPQKRLVPSSSLDLIVDNGRGLFPNPRSYYSFVNPNFNDNDNAIGVKLCMRLPSYDTRQELDILFADVMVVDMYSTRTVASLPSDTISRTAATSTSEDEAVAVNGTYWGEEFTLYILLAGVDFPPEIESVLASDTNKFLLRWDKTTSVPGLVYRLVVNRDLDVDEEGCLKDELKGRKDNVSLEWIM